MLLHRVHHLLVAAKVDGDVTAVQPSARCTDVEVDACGAQAIDFRAPLRPAHRVARLSVFQEQQGFMQLQIFRDANDFIRPFGSSL